MDYGYIRSLPRTFDAEVYSIKLNYTGAGVTFYISSGGLWQKIEPGQETLLDQPGSTLTIRAYLTLDAGTNLQDYTLDINPYHDMSFTGKFLEPEIGLIYFGGRWYEPGIGRWITPDPSEDGENWYEYCGSDPIDNVDPDGMISWKNLWTLCKGIGAGFKMYAPQKALEIGIALAVGSAITVGISALMPVLPAAIPVITAVMPYISAIVMVAFAMEMADDLQYIIKQFSPVVLKKDPSESSVRSYGIRISKIALTVVAMVATQKGMEAIIRTGILQSIGVKIGEVIVKNTNVKPIKSTSTPVSTGETHHAISKKIYKATDQHANLKGKYEYRDSRYTTQAVDAQSHRGCQSWHRNLDNEVAQWVHNNPNATTVQFEDYLRWRYSQPDLKVRFPHGL